MARIAPFLERQGRYRCESQEAWHEQRRDILPEGDVLMERILRRINATPQEEVLRKIAPLVGIRRHKVLDIRRRIAEGAYDVADRLDGVVDRVLEVIIRVNAAPCAPPARCLPALQSGGAGTRVTSLSCLVADRRPNRR